MYFQKKTGLESSRLPKSLFYSESSQIKLSGYSKPFQTTQANKPADTKLSFRDFIALVNPKYQFYSHLEKLIAILQRVADDEIKRLMIFMGPRHGKSETTSRLFTAYYLYRHPDRWVGLNSYADALASTLSRNARENFKTGGGAISPGVESVHHWETTAGGGMWAAGVGGPISGKGFHLGLIDDPLKNAEDAQSVTIQEKQKDWYRSTFGTREEPGAAIVIIQTRWNEADLSGWLLEQEKEDDEIAENWHIVSMEAIKGDTNVIFPATCTVEPDERQIGEALCPERYNIEKLRKIKRRLGAYFWGALYGQSPTPIAGGIFKRHQWRYWKPRNSVMPPVPVQLEDGSIIEIEAVEIPSTFEEQLQSWDCTFKDTKTSDYVAGQVWAREGANKYMLDYKKERLDINGTMAGIRYFTSKWPGAVAKLIEDKANGPAVIQMMHDFVTGMIAVNPRGGKLSRANAVAPEVESGNIYLPHPSLFIWVDEFINSCAGFPNMAHDDDVDAFTQAILGMSRFGSDELLEDLFRWN